MIKIDWILISIKTKPKFMIKIFYLKNTENVTSHHVHKKKSFSPGKRAGKQKQLIESKGKLAMRVTIRFSFHTPHSGPPFFDLIVNVLNDDVKSFLKGRFSRILEINLILWRKSCTAYNHSHTMQGWITITGSII